MYSKKDKISNDNIEQFVNEIFSDLDKGEKSLNIKFEKYDLTYMTNQQLVDSLESSEFYEEVTQFVKFLISKSKVHREIIQSGALDINDIINDTLMLVIECIRTNSNVTGKTIIFLIQGIIYRNFKKSMYNNLMFNDFEIRQETQYLQKYIKNEIELVEEKQQKLDLVLYVKDIINKIGYDIVKYLINEYEDKKLLVYQIEQIDNTIEVKFDKPLNRYKVTSKNLSRVQVEQVNDLLKTLNKQMEIEEYLRGFGVVNREYLTFEGYQFGFGHVNRPTILYALDMIEKEQLQSV